MYKKKFLLNKKVFHNFYIIKTFNAGMSLKGWEIKSIRSKNINISNSYISIIKKNIYLTNYNINLLNNNLNIKNVEKNRNIQLLLKKKEIIYLSNEIFAKNITIVPICLFWKNFLCKIKIGLAKGIKKYDKRNIKKAQEWKVEKLRLIKKSKRDIIF
ncbi:SsrA-binding protein SmpB [Buchnera aphidicola (Chaitoregma tattakana)]|uniref:SsrA-binding protein SmpB n=1 Tax=Buchnera aphidicola TaxID=9 RepID=UPI0031B7F6AF